jgi:N-acyl-L-homoserine lactone synthetase
MSLTRESRRIAGLLLLSIVAIESGGYYLTRVVTGAVEVTDFQLAFSRAGHAHAGVLVTLSLIAIVLADAAGARGAAGWVARLGIPVAAILMPAGFFFSSMGEGRTEPNGLIVLLWLGAASLAAGVVTLGLRLLMSTREVPVGAPR